MVRVGQAWAGYGWESITSGQFRREASQFRPIVTWRSRIVCVKTVDRGTKVGYGATWTARRPSRIGVVSVGYADGYPMGVAATDDDPKPACVGVEVAGAPQDGSLAFCRVIGQVNMDQITIDLTEIAPPDRDPSPVRPGAAVELIGTDPGAPTHAARLAKVAGTIPHELFCRLNPRIKRLYHATKRYDVDPVVNRAPLAERV